MMRLTLVIHETTLNHVGGAVYAISTKDRLKKKKQFLEAYGCIDRNVSDSQSI